MINRLSISFSDTHINVVKEFLRSKGTSFKTNISNIYEFQLEGGEKN